MVILRRAILAAAALAALAALTTGGPAARGSLFDDSSPANSCSYGEVDFFAGVDLVCPTSGVVTPFVCEFCNPTFFARFVSESTPRQMIIVPLGKTHVFPEGTWDCDWGACEGVTCPGDGVTDPDGGCYGYSSPPRIPTCTWTAPSGLALTTKLICPAVGGTMIVRQQPATGHVTGLGLEGSWPLMLVSASPPYTVIALKYGVPATIPRGTWTCEWRNCMDAVQPGVWSCPIGGGCAGAAAATRGSSWRPRR